jgi:hypothetical protein
MKLWEEVLVLRTRFEERMKRGGDRPPGDSIESVVWEQAFNELDALVKRQTRSDPTKPYQG